MLENLFQQFYHGTTTDFSSEDTRLRKAHVYKLVHSHDGTISDMSELSKVYYPKRTSIRQQALRRPFIFKNHEWNKKPYISFFNSFPCFQYNSSVDRFAKNTPIKIKHAPIPITGLIGSPKNIYPVITASNGET